MNKIKKLKRHLKKTIKQVRIPIYSTLYGDIIGYEYEYTYDKQALKRLHDLGIILSAKEIYDMPIFRLLNE